MLRTCLAFWFTLSVTGSSVAATAYDTFTVVGLGTYSDPATAVVDGVTVNTTAFGACMIRVTPNPASVLAGCGNNWITFSCSGDFNAKSVGSGKYADAQLAFVTSNTIEIGLDNTKLHNGMCFGTFAQIIP